MGPGQGPQRYQAMNSEAPSGVRNGTTGLLGVSGAFIALGRIFSSVGGGLPWPGHASGVTRSEYEAFDRHVREAGRFNGWYTGENVRHALSALGTMMEEGAMRRWLSAYGEGPVTGPRRVGLVLAGNVPMVGWHDVMSTLLAGHHAVVKCSSQEPALIPAAITLLCAIDPSWAGRVTFTEGPWGEVDALIATGSDNTARHFEHYFGHLPRIVRRSRTSMAVLDGTETESELAALGEDVFRHFGLGCRNVAKVLLPADFDTDRLFKAFLPWQHVVQHHKYTNNLDYHRALWLLDGAPFLENGFLILKEDAALFSPVGTLYYQRYADRRELQAILQAHAPSLQCVVGHGHIPFGQAQCPGPADHADGVDTMAFLLGLR